MVIESTIYSMQGLRRGVSARSSAHTIEPFWAANSAQQLFINEYTGILLFGLLSYIKSPATRERADTVPHTSCCPPTPPPRPHDTAAAFPEKDRVCHQIPYIRTESRYVPLFATAAHVQCAIQVSHCFSSPVNRCFVMFFQVSVCTAERF